MLFPNCKIRLLCFVLLPLSSLGSLAQQCTATYCSAESIEISLKAHWALYVEAMPPSLTAPEHVQKDAGLSAVCVCGCILLLLCVILWLFLRIWRGNTSFCLLGHLQIESKRENKVEKNECNISSIKPGLVYPPVAILSALLHFTLHTTAPLWLQKYCRLCRVRWLLNLSLF